MPSCLGPDGGKAGFRHLGLTLGKIALTCGLTAFLVVHLFLPRFLRSEGIDPSDMDVLSYLVLALIASPLCWGFHALFSMLLKGQPLSGLPVALASLSTAAVMVYLLPGPFLFLFVFISTIVSYPFR